MVIVARIFAEASETLAELTEHADRRHTARPSEAEHRDLIDASVASPSIGAVGWSLLVGGAMMAGVSMTAGLLDPLALEERARSRLRARVRDHVKAVLLESESGQVSVLAQVQARIADAASRAKADRRWE